MPGYRQEVAGESEGDWSRWVQPVTPEHNGRAYRMACCDCGLVHEIEFRIEDGRVLFRVRRHNRATAAIRAWDRRRAAGP